MARLLAILARVALQWWSSFGVKRLAAVWMLCALTLLVSGCASSAVRTDVPPAPLTPGAVMTDDYVCIPHAEAGELLLWVEIVEQLCR